MDESQIIPVTDYRCFTESKRYECSLIWTINDVSFYFHRTKCNRVKSPSFSTPNNASYTWFLELESARRDDMDDDETYGMRLRLQLVKDKLKKAAGNVFGILKTDFINSKGEKLFTKNEKFKILLGLHDYFIVELDNYKLRKLVFGEINNFSSEDVLKIHCQISFISDVETETKTFLDLNAYDMSKYSPIEDFEKLLNNEDCTHSDVAIHVGERKFPAHKAILSVRSTVFKAMFTHPMEENLQNRIDIKEIGEEVFEEVLRFIYTGKVKNLETLVFELFVAADRYDIEGLKYLCKNAMCGMISINTVLKIASFSKMHSLDIVKTTAHNYIRTHANEVVNSQDWDEFSSRADLMKEIFEIVFKH